MTVTGNYLKEIYTLDESTTVFPYRFKITANEDMEVTLYNTVTRTGTDLTLDTDFTVVGAGLDSGTRNVTYAGATAYDSDYQLILKSSAAYTQPTDYEENDDFLESTHELAIDRLCIEIKQLKELLDRTFKLDAAQESQVEFPSGTSGYLYSDGSGNFSWDTLTTTSTDYNGTISRGTDAEKPANPSIGDIYFATDVKKLYGCWSTGAWSVNWVLGDIAAGDVTVDDIDADTGTIDVLTGSDLTVTSSVTLDGFEVDEILDEDDMSSDSATALATQQSIKAYVDDEVAPSNAIIKAWCSVNSSSVILGSYNVSSITDGGTGDYIVNWDTDFADTNYCVVATTESTNVVIRASVLAAGTVEIDTLKRSDGSPIDAAFHVIAIGNQ